MSGVTAKTRATVLDRDQYRCARCGEYVGPWDYSLHHRRPRGQGGSKRPETNLPGNLLVLCGSGVSGCHGYVEKARDWAFNNGFLVHQATDDPCSVPVQTWRGKALLSNDGMLALVAEDA